MNNTQYFLLNNSPNQPKTNIRCKIVDGEDKDEYVFVQVCDIRFDDCPRTVVKRENLTPCD